MFLIPPTEKWKIIKGRVFTYFLKINVLWNGQGQKCIKVYIMLTCLCQENTTRLHILVYTNQLSRLRRYSIFVNGNNHISNVSYRQLSKISVLDFLIFFCAKANWTIIILILFLNILMITEHLYSVMPYSVSKFQVHEWFLNNYLLMSKIIIYRYLFPWYKCFQQHIFDQFNYYTELR